MRLSAITLARVLVFIETYDLDPKGKIFFPDLAQALVARFRFQKFPQKFEELDGQKGIQFAGGIWNGIAVPQLQVYTNGILLDTCFSTDDSERIIEETLIWAADEFKVNYQAKMLQQKRKRYLSGLTFYSEAPLLKSHSAIANLSISLDKILTDITGHQLSFEATNLTVDFCRLENQIPMAAFILQRRLDTPFSENKYFSEAPLPTDIHLKLLERFEQDLIG